MRAATQLAIVGKAELKTEPGPHGEADYFGAKMSSKSGTFLRTECKKCRWH